MSITRILTYSQVKGASVSLPCRVATTANITLSGAQTIDSIPLQVGDRVLVKDQNTGSENGIYVVSLGAWSRAVDMSLDDDVFEGLNIYVSQGVTNGPKFWIISTPPPVTLSNLSFSPDQEIHGTSGTSGTSGTFGTSGTNGTSGGSGTSGTSGTIGTSASSGTSGTNGTSGLSDSSGTSGTSGESSTQGSSGTSATSGSNGTSGTNGLSFTSGTGGTSGTSTSSGTSGTSATSGSNGISGTSGSGGVSGTSGSIGTSGSSGNSGVRGSSGTNGTTGTSGSSGTSGNAGARGVSGSSGTTGNTGPTGPTGSQGPTGPTGLLGAQGAPGPSGPQGPTGFIGPQGAQGPRGAQGSVGAPGTQGPQGPTGPTGATGFQGPPGPMGPPGPTGPPGPSATATVNAGTTDAIPRFANSTSVSPSIMFSKSPGPFNGIAIGPNTISPWANTRMFPIELRINSPAAQSCIFPDGTGNTIWNGANLYFNNVAPSTWAFATSGWGSIISQTTGLTSTNTGAFTTWYTPNISSGADTNLPVFNAVWQVQSSFATAPTYTTNGTCTTTGSNGRLAISSNSKMKIFDGFIEDGLGMLMKMLPRYFYWRDTATYGEGRHLGFYAQELSEISEEISNKPTTEDGQWAIDDRAVLAVITKANQEMEAKIDILKSKILNIKELINQAKN